MNFKFEMGMISLTQMVQEIYFDDDDDHSPSGHVSEVNKKVVMRKSAFGMNGSFSFSFMPPQYTQSLYAAFWPTIYLRCSVLLSLWLVKEIFPALLFFFATISVTSGVQTINCTVQLPL